MTTTTDTPRTDAAWSTYGDDYELELFARQLEREINEMRAALGDDGRRTHKEIIELATKASEWRTWKQKYIDLRNAHIAEGQDPAGTIWEHADKLQKELKASEAEVERLGKELADWDYGTRAKREQERAKKAEAENVCLQELIQEFYEWTRRDFPTEQEVREIMNRYHDLLNK